MNYTRRFLHHWWTDATSDAWIADATLDVSKFPEGAIPLTFDVMVKVPAGATATISLRTGGAAEAIGVDLAASATVVGPFVGHVTGVSAAGILRTDDPVLLHLSAWTTDDGKPIEVEQMTIRLGE